MTTQQIVKRNGKSQRLKVIKTDDSHFVVESSEGKIFYSVAIGEGGPQCSCADFIRNRKSDPNFMCKHLIAIHDSDGVFDEGMMLDRKQAKLDQRFIKNISGRDFVLYSGILDLAHQRGLLKLSCEIIQYPCSDNGYEAVCKATAETKNGEVFVDIGDANKTNVNKMISVHILRMASTRAKARALRDLTNIGMTCLEELGDLKDVIGVDIAETKSAPQKAIPKQQVKNADPAFSDAKTTVLETRHEEKAEEKTSKAAQTAVHERPAKAVNNGSKDNGSKEANASRISEAQRRAMLNLAKRRGHSESELGEMVKQSYGISIDALSTQQASAFIRQIQSAA